MTTRRRSPSWMVIALVQLGVVAAIAAAYAGLSPERKQQVDVAILRAELVPTVPVERKTPLSVSPLYDDPELVSDDELAAVLYQLQPRFPAEKLKPNFIEHALRAWGMRAEFKDPNVLSGATMVDFLVNHGSYRKSWGDEKADKSPLLQEKTHGVSIKIGTDPSESVHHDHWLACLTEAGVPLDEKVFGPGRHNSTMNDVLQEALRDFRLDERETEWSAMAFGFWIAPVRSWKTTTGREISFDMIAKRLMRGDKRLGVCNGTHRVYSLVVLLRLDDEFDILSDPIREQVWKHLENIRDLIKVSQFEDGHWPTNWSKGAEALTDPANDVNYRKVINTGHHLEWMAIAPKELHPPRGQILAAAKWVINDTISKTEADILDKYTFYSHVANALSLWRKTHPADYWMKWEKDHPDQKGKPEVKSETPKLPELPALPSLPGANDNK